MVTRCNRLKRVEMLTDSKQLKQKKIIQTIDVKGIDYKDI